MAGIDIVLSGHFGPKNTPQRTTLRSFPRAEVLTPDISLRKKDCSEKNQDLQSQCLQGSISWSSNSYWYLGEPLNKIGIRLADFPGMFSYLQLWYLSWNTEGSGDSMWARQNIWTAILAKNEQFSIFFLQKILATRSQEIWGAAGPQIPEPFAQKKTKKQLWCFLFVAFLPFPRK